VATPDARSNPDARLVAAARAAASWARARRATWTNEPLDVPLPIVAAPTVEVPTVDLPIVESPIAADIDLDDGDSIVVIPGASAPVAAASIHDRPIVSAIATPRALAAAPRIGRWIGIGVVALAIAGAIATGGWYAWQTLSAMLARRPAAESAAPAEQAAPAAGAALGTLRVTSTPSDARVLVDGKARGVTPLTVADLKPGTHELTIISSAGTVRRSVTIGARDTVDVDESIFAGWIAVLAPFDIEVSEGGRALAADERGQILLPPGAHDLRLANRSLDFVTTQQVEVKPGTTTTVRVTPPASTLTVTAADPSEVWLDGARLGNTPLTAATVPLGTHDVVVRRAGAADRRFTITVGTGPVVLNADTGR